MNLRQDEYDEEKYPLKKSSNGYGSTKSNNNDDFNVRKCEGRELHQVEIIAILSTAFAYGCVMTTLFLITIPVECNRIQHEHPTIQKSISLALFVAIAGLTQLVSPLAGMLSDSYKPPARSFGQRLPYLVLGAILTVVGLFGQMLASEWRFWIRYALAFFFHMIGLTIIYSMMLALIPDQVPESQTGVANGMLAFLLVTGSLFGFGLFHTFLSEDIESMYGLYICIVIVTTILTCTYGHEKDVENAERRKGTIPPEQSKTPNPYILLKSLLYDPLKQLEWKVLAQSYTIDVSKYHDFFIVTVSRTFYYLGISVQTFFMYYVHDIINIHEDPQSMVATLAILGQVAGAVTCYPVGLISDRLCGGARKPFVYLACAILSTGVLALTFCTTTQHVIIVCMVLGGANGMYLTMDTSLAVDTLPDNSNNDEEGGDNHAQLLGVWGVAGFLGSALGPLIGAPMLVYFGKTNNDNTTDDEGNFAYSIYGYAVLFSLSASYFLFSAWVLRRIEDPNA